LNFGIIFFHAAAQVIDFTFLLIIAVPTRIK
jgi:hypothetical protein